MTDELNSANLAAAIFSRLSLFRSILSHVASFHAGPRGAQHHKNYLERFKDYPRNRNAVIPFIW